MVKGYELAKDRYVTSLEATAAYGKRPDRSTGHSGSLAGTSIPYQLHPVVFLKDPHLSHAMEVRREGASASTCTNFAAGLAVLPRR